MRTLGRWNVLLILCGALLITSLDNTIMNVALPSIQEDLHATTPQLQWIVDSYTVLFAGTLLLAGSLGDRFGRRRLLLIGLVTFALGSIAAATAPNPDTLALYRALMGVGGACIMPSTLSILVQIFPDRGERARAIGIWAGVSGIGVAIGPIAGGLLLEHFSWHSIFWVNPPIAAIVLVLTLLFVAESQDPSKPRLDLLGAALSATGLSALIITIISLPDSGFDSFTIGCGTAAILLLGAFVWWEARVAQPILPLGLLRNRAFSISVVLVALLYFSLFGAMFFMPQFLQLVQGMTPLQSGAAILPGAVGLAIASVFSPRLAESFGARRVVVCGLSLVTIGIGSASFLTSDTNYWYIGFVLGLMGAGIGLTLPHATNGVLSAVPSQRAGMGSAVNETMGEIGGAMGVAILGALLSAAYRSNIDTSIASAGEAIKTVPTQVLDLARESLAAASVLIPQLPAQYVQQARAAVGQAFVTGMDSALFIAAGITAVGVALAAIFFPARMTHVDE